MEEALFPLKTMLPIPSDALMDLGFMDQLFLEGCWLGTTEGSEFLLHDPSTLNALFDPSVMFLDNYHELSGSQTNQSQEEIQWSPIPQNLSISQSKGKRSPKTLPFWENNGNSVTILSQSEKCSVENLELSRSQWIGPRASLPVMERLIHALGFIKDCSRDKNVLVQTWVPVNRDGRRVLITNGQPFSLDLKCPRLVRYRDISRNFEFPADEDSKQIAGLPGRVFMGKVPEWTPDVRFFSQEEYPRVNLAQQYDVRGTLAVPVFEQGSCNCLGVVEVVLTTQKVNYSAEIESVCKALQAVDLSSSKVSSSQNVKGCDLSYQAPLPELLKVLKSACMAHGMPLAQTWVPCVQQGKGGSRHSDENLVQCVSTVDSACYIADPNLQGFHEACSEHHLLKGQGIVGRAFTTNQPCFSSDVTSGSKTDYPLSHHARMFGLFAAVAIRLRCTCTGSTDFVLEFFLPKDCREPKEQNRVLHSLSIIIQNGCQNFLVVTDRELQEEAALPLVNAVMPSNTRTLEQMPTLQHIEATRPSQEMFSNQVEVQENTGKTSRMQDQPSEFMQHQLNSSSVGGVVFGYSTSCKRRSLRAGKTGEKRRGKAEETITLQVLQQYFPGSLKDAANSLGVCPTTLKRICRLHGIKRWPSRQIKKVGYSLRKIHRVIESVQGASGALQIESFYSNFPELASPNSSRTSPFSDLSYDDQEKSSHSQPHCSMLNPQAAASKSRSSSCSQNSISSQCCSSGTIPHLFASHDGTETRDDPDNSELKRVRSDAELHLANDGRNVLPTSQSHMSLLEHSGSQKIHSSLKERSRRRTRQEGIKRVKVSYGEEKISFCMKNNWGYKDLLQLIVTRFGIDDTCGFDLKYLDDDSEWVLLTCDADLEECIDVCSCFHNQTIKLCLVRDSGEHI